MISILRIDAAKARAGFRSNASVYTLIRAGKWTKPVRISERCSGWPAHEVDALCKAKIAGATELQIRQLVDRLHAERAELLPTI